MAGAREISREIFDRLYPKLVARFSGFGVPASEVEDLVQETLVRANGGLSSFDGRSELDTWVISIAKRVWLNDLRKKRTEKRQADEVAIEPELELAEPSGAWGAVEDRILIKDLLSRVGKAIEELPEPMRTALIMYCHGEKYREISRRLEITENRVASLIFQARAKLRRRFLS